MDRTSMQQVAGEMQTQCITWNSYFINRMHIERLNIGWIVACNVGCTVGGTVGCNISCTVSCNVDRTVGCTGRGSPVKRNVYWKGKVLQLTGSEDIERWGKRSTYRHSHKNIFYYLSIKGIVKVIEFVKYFLMSGVAHFNSPLFISRQIKDFGTM